MIKLTGTPLDTPYTNQLGGFAGTYAGPDFDYDSTAVYTGIRTQAELNAARGFEARAEDRFLAAIAGALPSEIWN